MFSNAPSDLTLKRSDVTTLFSVFKARVNCTPKSEAFRFFDIHTNTWKSIDWSRAYQQMIKARDALLTENLRAGDRIVIAFNNSPSWVYVEQAALYMGLVVVALPATTPINEICQTAKDVDAKILFVESDLVFHALSEHHFVQQVSMKIVYHAKTSANLSAIYYDQWLKNKIKSDIKPEMPWVAEESLATIMYTSGSCGKPKGVMHSHQNIINNAFACLERIDVNYQDKMLSVTPIAHCLERVAGYYVAMIAGACIVFSKSPNSILEDLSESQATILVTTPHHINKAYKRLLESLVVSATLVDQYLDYLHSNGKWRFKFLCWPLVRGIIEKKAKKRLLHQLKFIISGGSALSPKIISLSSFLNLPIIQGYGLTEAGGVVSTNTIGTSMPFSVGKPLSNTKILVANDGELYIQSNSLMLGYWKGKMIDKDDFWLHTEDLVRLDNEHIVIEGRKNNQIHLSTGEIISPAPIEQTLIQNTLFENVALFGEGKKYATIFCQLNIDEWQQFLGQYAQRKELNKAVFTDRLKSILLIRMNAILQTVPGHPHIHLVFPTLEPWTVDNGLLNTQGKVNKKGLEVYFSEDIKLLD